MNMTCYNEQDEFDKTIELLSNKNPPVIGVNSPIRNKIFNDTSFIAVNATIAERAKYIKFGLKTQATCPMCDTPVNVDSQIHEYVHNKYCSSKCRKAGYRVVKRGNSEFTACDIAAMKRKKYMAVVDPTTGLNKGQVIGLTASKTKAIINPETGLSLAKEIGKKSKATLSKIDPETGLTGHVLRSVNAKATLSKIDPKTGLSGHESKGLKSKQTKLKLNPETGLTGYQLTGINIKHSLSKINSETGMTRSQEIGLKTKQTMSKINPETGLTGHQSIARLSRSESYNRITERYADQFEILTTHDEYVSREFDDHVGARDISYKCKTCCTVRTTSYLSIRCLECNPHFISIPEKQVFEFCAKFTDDLEFSNRALIYPLEVDIYSEKYKLAVEFDGVYWHSSDLVVNEKKDYHLEKTQLCEDQGVQLLHIFENEWAIPEKQLIWKSIIRNKFGESNRIFARKCVIREVDSRTTRMFLENNHLQGSCSSSINYGLYYNDELVSLMTFGKSRYNKKYKYELIRFCSTLNASVTGGASKLFKHFIKNHKGSVISYADKRRSDGNLYRKLGFELSHETEPNYFYVDHKDQLILHSRVKFQKHKLPELLEIFDKSKTESENMYNNGYRKIFDCGNYAFVYESH